MNSNYAKGRLQALVRNHENGIVRHRQLFFFLLLLVFGMASNITTALATTSANRTTINVGNVGPTKVFAGAQNVAILSFTVQVNPAGVSETLRDALVQCSGDSTADIASVQLYREIGAVPGTFNPASDTLLASATSPVSDGYDLDPANFTLAMGPLAHFYFSVRLNPAPLLSPPARPTNISLFWSTVTLATKSMNALPLRSRTRPMRASRQPSARPVSSTTMAPAFPSTLSPLPEGTAARSTPLSVSVSRRPVRRLSQWTTLLPTAPPRHLTTTCRRAERSPFPLTRPRPRQSPSRSTA